MRALLFAFVGALASLPVATTTVGDAPPPRGLGMALRKDVHEDDPPEGPAAESEVETLATLVNVHTGDVMPLAHAEPTEQRFSASLQDRVTGSSRPLDPRLLDLLRRLAETSPGMRIELVSGYRSPKLNEMLRKKGHNVASHSQHSLGHAVDFRIVGLTPAEMKKKVKALGWDGGIGRYDKPTDWFVHADVGPKREWYEGPGRRR